MDISDSDLSTFGAGPPFYDPRLVPAHGSESATVFLMNEAPGPAEAEGGIPLYGAQGGVLFRELRKAGIGWARNVAIGDGFKWPSKALSRYKSSGPTPANLRRRDEVLAVRRRVLVCTNAFPYWPRPALDGSGFVKPRMMDVLRPQNVLRLTKEMAGCRILLICGEFAMLACKDRRPKQPAAQEGRELSSVEVGEINSRFGSKFEFAWYLGHTRRWSLRDHAATLREIGVRAGWKITTPR